MTHRKKFTPKPAVIRWEPSATLMESVNKLTMVRDKIEVLFAHCADQHGGQGLTAGELGHILKRSKQGIQRRMEELIDGGRAMRLHGKFFLVPHPDTQPSVRSIVRRLSRGVVYPVESINQPSNTQREIAVAKVS